MLAIMYLLCECGHKEPLYWVADRSESPTKEFVCPKCGKMGEVTLRFGEIEPKTSRGVVEVIITTQEKEE